VAFTVSVAFGENPKRPRAGSVSDRSNTPILYRN